MSWKFELGTPTKNADEYVINGTTEVVTKTQPYERMVRMVPPSSHEEKYNKETENLFCVYYVGDNKQLIFKTY